MMKNIINEEVLSMLPSIVEVDITEDPQMQGMYMQVQIKIKNSDETLLPLSQVLNFVWKPRMNKRPVAKLNAIMKYKM